MSDKVAKVYGYAADGTPLYTQRQVVKDYLVSTKKGISQAEAWALWGFSRLSAIIFDIRKELEDSGSKYRIAAIDKTGVNRYNISCNWTEYRLVSK